MIKYILQVQGQNLLQVHYTSGANRYIEPNQYYCYGSNMTKTQLDYMHNAKMYEMINANGFGRSHYYYLLDSSSLIDFIERRNKTEENQYRETARI